MVITLSWCTGFSFLPIGGTGIVLLCGQQILLVCQRFHWTEVASDLTTSTRRRSSTYTAHVTLSRVCHRSRVVPKNLRRFRIDPLGLTNAGRKITLALRTNISGTRRRPLLRIGLMILGPVGAREHPLLNSRLLHRSFSRGDPGTRWQQILLGAKGRSGVRVGE